MTIVVNGFGVTVEYSFSIYINGNFIPCSIFKSETDNLFTVSVAFKGINVKELSFQEAAWGLLRHLGVPEKQREETIVKILDKFKHKF